MFHITQYLIAKMSAQLILKINVLKYKSDRYTVTVDHKTTDKGRSTAKS